MDLSDRESGLDLTPDDECGSVQFLGWAGLFKDFPEPGWYMIKIESPAGIKEWEVHEESEEPQQIAWSDIQHELSPEYDEPEEGDFVIQDRPHGYEVSPGGDGFISYQSAVVFIQEQMDRDTYYPDVWLMDDHGGFTNISDEFRVGGKE